MNSASPCEMCKRRTGPQVPGPRYRHRWKDAMPLKGWHHSRDHSGLVPRIFRLVALPAPSRPRKKRRCTSSVIGGISLGRGDSNFDRSWYNALVSTRQVFCSRGIQHEKFPRSVPFRKAYLDQPESLLINTGWNWTEEHHRRVSSSHQDPLRHIGSHPMASGVIPALCTKIPPPLTSCSRPPRQACAWYVFAQNGQKSEAQLHHTSAGYDPYGKFPRGKVEIPNADQGSGIHDQASLKGRHFVPEKY